jgi:hypothetical protein
MFGEFTKRFFSKDLGYSDYRKKIFISCIYGHFGILVINLFANPA